MRRDFHEAGAWTMWQLIDCDVVGDVLLGGDALGWGCTPFDVFPLYFLATKGHLPKGHHKVGVISSTLLVSNYLINWFTRSSSVHYNYGRIAIKEWIVLVTSCRIVQKLQ